MLTKLYQANPIVGDVKGNAEKIITAIEKDSKQFNLLVFPECFLSGYPLEDAVEDNDFMDEIISTTKNIFEIYKKAFDKNPYFSLIFGLPIAVEPGQKIGHANITNYSSRRIFNAACIMVNGSMSFQMKVELPNYDVFDEIRIFESGTPYIHPISVPVDLNKSVNVGLMICEDMWHPRVAQWIIDNKRPDFFLSINGSPYETDKFDKRYHAIGDIVGKHGIPLVYLNMVGGQDELVFDGQSLVAIPEIHQIGKTFEEDEIVLHFDGECFDNVIDITFTPMDRREEEYSALLVGLRDYIEKNSFKSNGVIIGLSGGIDSALCAALAVDAFGADRVWGIRMPSKYSSDHSLGDAEELAKNLGIKLSTFPIETVHDAMVNLMDIDVGVSSVDPDNLADQNIQARIRGQILMWLSNRYGYMVISTGNKSEWSVGYATLYGDMCGGFAAIKDVYKTVVFDLCEWRNRHKPVIGKGPDGIVIPVNTITKPPSAELAEGQADTDSLPPYDVLDSILTSLIECGGNAPHHGTHEDYERVKMMLNRAEYKRRQGPPGTKITSRNFGKGRRVPIVYRRN
ncbi:MAG: NAD+ synthase [Candidimonas sp.]